MRLEFAIACAITTVFVPTCLEEWLATRAEDAGFTCEAFLAALSDVLWLEFMMIRALVITFALAFFKL